MKIQNDSPMLTPRLPVVGHLRRATDSPEVLSLKVVGLLVLAILALSALCVVVAQHSERAAVRVMDRLDEIGARMDEEQRLAELQDEKGDPH